MKKKISIVVICVFLLLHTEKIVGAEDIIDWDLDSISGLLSIGEGHYDIIPLRPDMFSTNQPTNYPDSEGFEMMLDGNLSTYFQSTWGVNGTYTQKSENVCLDIALDEPISLFQFYYCSRNYEHYNPLSFIIWAAGDDGIWKAQCKIGIEDGMPTVAGNSEYTSPPIELDGIYNHLRFELTEAEHTRVQPDGFILPYLSFAEFRLFRYASGYSLKKELELFRQFFQTNKDIIRKVAFTDGVTTVCDSILKGGTKISSISLSETVTSIGSSAFFGCSNLEAITIPYGVTSIGKSAFEGCTNLKDVFCFATNPPKLGTNNFEGADVRVPIASYASYVETAPWSSLNLFGMTSGEDLALTINVRTPGTLPSEILRQGHQSSEVCRLSITGEALNQTDWSVMLTQMPILYELDLSGLKDKEIPASAMNGKHILNGLQLPKTIEVIGDSAFYGCTLRNLELVVPNQTKTIGKSAFSHTLLSRAEIESAERIESKAFYDCPRLSSVTLPEGLVVIGDSAFVGSKITDVTLPSTLKTIQNGAFAGLPLSSITLPKKLLAVGIGAFNGCTQLEGVVTLPEHLVYMQPDVFKDCKHLEEIVYHRGMTIIGEEAFSGCQALKRVVIPTGLMKIEDRAFFDCLALDTIDIPATLQEIGKEAFAGCTNVKQLTVHWEVPPTLAEENQFEGIDKKTCKLVVPQMTAGLYMTAPVWKDFVFLSENYEVEEHYIEELDSLLHYAETWMERVEEAEGTSNLQAAIDEGWNVINKGNYYVLDFTDAMEKVQTALETCMGNRRDGFLAVIQTIEDFMATDESGVSTDELNRLLAEAKVTLEGDSIEAQNAAFDALSFEFNTLVTLPEGKFYYTGLLPEIACLSPYDVTLEADSLVKDAGNWETDVKAVFAKADTTFVKHLSYSYVILPAPLTITAKDTTMVYGEEMPEFVLSYDGFVNAEDETVLDVLPTIQTEATQDSDAGEYDLIVGGAEAKNYTISYTNGKLTIEKAPLNITIENTTMVYGEDMPEFVLSYDGFVNADDETVLDVLPTIQTEATQDSDAGEYDLIVCGAEAKNYTISYTNGKLFIEKASQEIIWEQEFEEEVMTGDTIMLTAYSSRGLPVAYFLENNDVAILSADEDNWYLICTGEGSSVIRAVQEGDKNHFAAEDVSKTIVVIVNTVNEIMTNGDSERYFQIDGVEINTQKKGINIVVVKKSDVKRTVRKIFVK